MASSSTVKDSKTKDFGNEDKKSAVNKLPANEDLPPSYQAVAGNQKRSFKAVDFVNDGKIHVLLAASGSVAPEILSAISERLLDEPEISVQIVLDKFAAKRLSQQTLLKLSWVSTVHTDADWQEENCFLHYELRSWLDFMLIAPCSPNTLANMTNGTGDDLINSILRVFDVEGKLNPRGRRGRCKYLAIAPAMDSATWMHPVTKEQVATLQDRWSYRQPFHRFKIHWAAIVKPLNIESDDYESFKEDGNMNLARIMTETRWQVDKFRPNNAWYRPGN